MGGWIGGLAWTVPLAVLVSGSGALVANVARRAVDGRLGPNQVAGIRTRATLRSAEAWSVAHVAGLRPTLWGARTLLATGPLTLAVGGGVALVRADRVEGYRLGFALVLLGGVALATALIALGARRGHRAAIDQSAG